MKIKTLMLGFLALGLVSCGGESKKAEATDLTVKAEDTTVGGSLGSYASLIAGDYTVQINESGTVDVTVKLDIQAIPDLMYVKELSSVKATLNFLGENGTPLSVDIEEDYNSELESAFKSGSSKLALKFHEYMMSEDKIEVLKSKAKAIEVSISGDIKEASSSSSSESSSSDSDSDSESDAEVASDSKTSSTDINVWLDKYEKVMDKYVSLVKKANNGDMSAMKDMASYLDQVNELYEDLENVQGDMTPAQSARLAKIYAKMSSSLF